MKIKRILLIGLVSYIAITAVVAIPLQRQQELLDRGVVAVKSGTNAFISWRLFASDPLDVKFNVYRNNESAPVNPTPLDAAHTNYTVANGAVAGTTYSVAVIYGAEEYYRSKPAQVWQQQYLNIPVQKPTTGHLPDGTAYTDYTIYDGTTADLDGDGQYEIVFFWGPANMQDNSSGGKTGNVFIDAYKLDGTKLWGNGKYIDLGSNIRAGAHYQTFQVFDFDGNGAAEIIVKTADGTTDTRGTRIGTSEVFVNSGGWILDGAEYLSVFEGATGKLIDSKPYDPPRHPTKLNPTGSELNAVWGDNYGNRCDRYLSAVAYLDGVRPSAVMCRGYYSRTTLCAWDFDGVNLKKRWLFDTRNMSADDRKKYEGQGNHNLAVMDVDCDGKDEIIYGALTINSNGTVRYSTTRGHGDAMHAGKLDPTRAGLQVISVHEGEPFGIEMHDASTGENIWTRPAGKDTGRGLCADVDPEYPGEESWGAAGLGVYASDGTQLNSSPSVFSMNMAIYWDGDTGRELLDGQSNPSITKVLAASGTGSNLRSYSRSTLITFDGRSTNGGTKANPCLQADILGDWREEVVLRTSDNSAISIYTTTTPTVHSGAGKVPASGIPTLMHNKAYRLAIAWQNAGYNQPPHTDFFLGYNMPDVVRDFEGVPFVVSIDPKGGNFLDGTVAIKTVTSVTGTHIALPKVSRDDGTQFAGWFFKDGEPYSPTAFTENVELQAKWGKMRTISFDANGGDEVAGVKTFIVGEPLGALPVPTRAKYVFTSWNTIPDGSGTTYLASTVCDLDLNFTLYAQWRERDSFVLAFDANGGDDVFPSFITVKFDSLLGPLPEPTHSGPYGFIGWNTESNGAGSFYTENTVYKFKDDFIVYAAWEEVDVFTITFDANGGVLSGSNSQDIAYGKKLGELPIPTRSGYVFVGWNDKKNGSGITYDEHTLYTRLVNTTLYAQWTEATSVADEVWPNLVVYPNPASEVMTIKGLKDRDIIKLLDISGRIVAVIVAVDTELSINVSSLVRGTYFVQVLNGKVAKSKQVVLP